MNQREERIFKFLMPRYKAQYDANDYYRNGHDEDTEFYLAYRNPNDYPLAYNESFPRILPTIYTLLSRFMDQLYQTSNVVSVKPRKSIDIERAKKVEATLNFQLESLNDIDRQGGSYLVMLDWFRNALTYGKGIIKCYWRKEERITPRRVPYTIPQYDQLGNYQGEQLLDYLTMEPQIAYEGPYVEVLHNKLFVPDVRYRSIQQMPLCFIVYKRSMDEIKRLADKGIYKNIKELGWNTAGGVGSHGKDAIEEFIKGLSIAGAAEQAEIDNPLKAPEVDVIEAYGKMILEDQPYTIGSGIQVKGPEEEVILHVGNYKTILSIQKNTYGFRPLFDIGAYAHPELYWDMGLVKLTKGIQRQIDNLANLRMQNVSMMINTMLRVDPESDIPPESLVWKPFGIVPAYQGEVEPLQIPDFHSNLFQEQENFFEHTIQDITGMYSYNMGQTPQRQERVGVVYGIQSMGEARAKLMLMTMDYLGIRPLLKYMMILNTFHLPQGFEYRISDGDEQSFGQLFGDDIHPDFDFAARYTAVEPALGKQARMQQLMQLAPVMLQNPWINQYQWWRTLLELSDIREAKYLLKDPQQYMQEAQQAAQMELMSEKAKQQFETEGKLLTSQQDFGEELTLNEQEFRHDMALKALEGRQKRAEGKKSS